MRIGKTTSQVEQLVNYKIQLINCFCDAYIVKHRKPGKIIEVSFLNEYNRNSFEKQILYEYYLKPNLDAPELIPEVIERSIPGAEKFAHLTKNAEPENIKLQFLLEQNPEMASVFSLRFVRERQ